MDGRARDARRAAAHGCRGRASALATASARRATVAFATRQAALLQLAPRRLRMSALSERARLAGVLARQRCALNACPSQSRRSYARRAARPTAGGVGGDRSPAPAGRPRPIFGTARRAIRSRLDTPGAWRATLRALGPLVLRLPRGAIMVPGDVSEQLDDLLQQHEQFGSSARIIGRVVERYRFALDVLARRALRLCELAGAIEQLDDASADVVFADINYRYLPQGEARTSREMPQSSARFRRSGAGSCNRGNRRSLEALRGLPEG
jgi:hypothetical protein